jgi:hypothetical protein
MFCARAPAGRWRLQCLGSDSRAGPHEPCRNRHVHGRHARHGATGARPDHPRPRQFRPRIRRGSITPSVIASIGSLRGALGLDHPAGGGQARIAGQIGLRQKHDIGAGDLILEHLGQRGFVVQAFVRRALGSTAASSGRTGPPPPPRHRPGHDAIDGDARADRGPVERLQKRLRQGEARGFDQDVIGRCGIAIRARSSG